ARATGDLNAVSGFFGNALVFLTSFTITFLGVAVVLFVVDPVLAVLTVGLIVPFVVSARHFNTRMRSVTRRSRQAGGEVSAAVEESVRGVRVLKGLGRDDWISARIGGTAEHLRNLNVEAVAIRSRYLPTLTLVPAVIVAVVLGVGGTRVVDGALSLGSLVAFNQYLALVLSPLRVAGWHLASAQQAAAAGQRILEVLDTKSAAGDDEHAPELAPVAGEVTFDRVDVAYPGSPTPALSEVSFTVRAGETVAVVGPSGSGKSTLVGLLNRMVDPTGGRVLIDGVDIRAVSLASLRGQVGMVFDDATLLRGSVRDNIAFSDPDASDAAVHRVARLAVAHDFVVGLPEGYDTAVGDQGFSLSGGQRQRVALARALLPRPRILVLDDALSSVDIATALAIEEALEAESGDRTTFVTTRRAVTAAKADRVIVLDEGRVVAVGRHQELLEHDAYRRIISTEWRDEDLVGAAGELV
ncbi:MAG: ABC transporter ATP-binding protein/permease, partial [Actinomycetota bacterium]|nr:ABC transporter ATP-binding protein/permease [Actinomycetota bacterium]